MKVSGRVFVLPVIAVIVIGAMAGCPLPYDYVGKGAAGNQTPDPSSPNVTSVVTVTCTAQGGAPVSVADGGSFVSGMTTTIALSTATNNSVIYYTDDGTALTNLNAAKKFNGSSGSITITRTTALQTLDIHAIAVGPSMLPSLPVHVTVSVSPYPVLTITSSKASISEDGGTATFTITSSTAPSSTVTVNLLTGGTYSTTYLTGLSGGPNKSFTANLAASATTITVPVSALHDPSTASRTVTLTIQPDTNKPTPTYSVGSPSSASVTIQDDGSFGVTYDGNGNTGGAVPTDSNYYLTGATVTVLGNTGNLVRTGYTFGGWNTQANGTGTAYAGGATFLMGSANVTLYAKWNLIPALYVNAATGNDANPGTAAAPFKTITKALSVVVAGGTVNVAAGTYNAANGETFPLYIPAQVTLTGNVAGTGSGVVILGGAEPSGYPTGFISAAVVMGTQSVLEGFTVTNNSTVATFPEGIVLDQAHASDGVIVANNTLTGNGDNGIYVNGGSSGGSINHNYFVSNGLNDLAFVASGGNAMSVSYNTFNDTVELDTLGPDLGGGAAGSPGHNSFLAASSTFFSCGGTVYAMNNHWNHNPPTTGAVRSGFDIGTNVPTTVITTGSY